MDRLSVATLIILCAAALCGFGFYKLAVYLFEAPKPRAVVKLLGYTLLYLGTCVSAVILFGLVLWAAKVIWP